MIDEKNNFELEEEIPLNDRTSGEGSSSSSSTLVQKLDEEISQQKGGLPEPVTANKPKPKLSAATIIPIWIVLSSSVILYNNYIYNTLGFEFPVFLVTWHLTFAVRILSCSVVSNTH